MSDPHEAGRQRNPEGRPSVISATRPCPIRAASESKICRSFLPICAATNPRPQRPFAGLLSKKEIDDVIAYITAGH
jgi:hypothetical protein